jgi:hypothetical protein
LAKSRQALHQAIQGLSEEEMIQVQVEGVWTIKDVLGHIASWEETCLEPLRCYADGGPFEAEITEDYLTWNDEQAAHKRDIPLDVILDELVAIRQRMVETANRMSAEQWEQKEIVLRLYVNFPPITTVMIIIKSYSLRSLTTRDIIPMPPQSNVAEGREIKKDQPRWGRGGPSFTPPSCFTQEGQAR